MLETFIYNQYVLWIMKLRLSEAKIWWNTSLHYNSHNDTHLSGMALNAKALALTSWGLVILIRNYQGETVVHFNWWNVVCSKVICVKNWINVLFVYFHNTGVMSQWNVMCIMWSNVMFETSHSQLLCMYFEMGKWRGLLFKNWWCAFCEEAKLLRTNVWAKLF